MRDKARAARRARRSLLLMPVLALVLSACGGPREPLVVGMKEIPSDIVLGTGKHPLLAPVPPVALPLNPPFLEGFVLPPTDGGPPVASGLCPSADPLKAPAREAVNTIALPPAPGVYLFRNNGSFEVSGANAAKGRFPQTTSRRVENVFKVLTPGSTEYWFRFDVVAGLAPLLTTTTTYTLVPEQSGPQVVSGTQPGLFITRVQTEFANGYKEDFQPANFPGLLLLPFPASMGDTWQAAGADPRSGMAMAFTGHVGRKARVNACGTPLDALTVQLDGKIGDSDGSGTSVSPFSQVSFVADYALATQYGGLSVMDLVKVDRAFPGGSLHHENHATIQEEPSLPPADVRICATGCVP